MDALSTKSKQDLTQNFHQFKKMRTENFWQEGSGQQQHVQALRTSDKLLEDYSLQHSNESQQRAWRNPCCMTKNTTLHN